MVNIRSYVYLYLVLSVNILLEISVGFNIDTASNFEVFSGEKGSMFGYSIALHIEKNQSWVICGAPKFQNAKPMGGGVFACASKQDSGNCNRLKINLPTSVLNESLYNISDAWLGARVESFGMDRPIVVCAPRLVYRYPLSNETDLYENMPTGSCFVMGHLHDATVEHIDPCKKRNMGRSKDDLMCQAGFSTAFSIQKDKEYLYVGSPSHQTISYSRHIHAFRLPEYTETKQRRKNFHLDHDVGTYFQYALASIKFGSKGVLVASMPRGSNYNGTVLIFDTTRSVATKIVGEQLGSYFGYALCVLDINGDTKDDLVISAPLFVKGGRSEQDIYDVGRVYVYIQNKTTETFWNPITIDGFNGGGRFGLALTSLMDIDKDGYMDFAVGAPYDGPENRGAVYIYRGKANGPLTAYSQAIYAEEFMNPPTTFGFSLSSGVDTDGNQYPDIAVGAYEANKVFLFKSRPVISVKGSIKFTVANNVFSLSPKNCTQNAIPVTCTNIESCFSFTGLAAPNKIVLSITWTLDVSTKGPRRIFYLESNISTTKSSIMNISMETENCVSHSVYLDPGLKDLLTPFVAEMKYTLHDSRENEMERSSFLLPIVDPLVETVKRDQFRLIDNCGSDGICIPDLKLNITTNHSHTLGSPDPLIFEISVSNNGEDAYETSFFMTFSEKLYFQKIEQSESIKPMCSVFSRRNNEIIQCDVGNPFVSGKSIKLTVYLIPSHKYDATPSYTLHFKVNSTNVENTSTTFDNTALETINIITDTRIMVTGTTVESNIYYNIKDYKPMEFTNETDIGPEVVHKFVIRPEGVTPIHQVNFYIQWPAKTFAGDDVLYFLEQIDEHQVTCHTEMAIDITGEPRGAEISTNRLKYTTGIDDNLMGYLSCTNFQCGTLSCIITNLSKSDDAWIVLRSRLVAFTIDRLAPDVPVLLSSRILASVTNRPYFNNSTDPGNVYMHEVVYNVIPQMEKIQIVPLWVVVASSPFGTIILLLMVYPLYKCGFFKRQKIPSSNEEL